MSTQIATFHPDIYPFRPKVRRQNLTQLSPDTWTASCQTHRSEGKRQVMEAGSVFHFGSNAPTGWEARFSEGAFLFIVKQLEEGLDYEAYTKDIRAMAAELDEEMAGGSAFYYNQLEPEHPAIQFARQHNPDFDEILAGLNL